MKTSAQRVMILAACLLAAACRGGDESSELIVVNAPVSGEVQRVMVREGAPLREGAVILEIMERPSQETAPQAPDDAQGRARAEIEAAEREVAAAETEAERALIEVQRVEQLVASGLASRSELEAARGVSQQAQQRLDQARQSVQRAADNLSLARRPPAARPVEPPRFVAVRAPALGTLRAISARPGQRVTQGRSLATISE